MRISHYKPNKVNPLYLEFVQLFKRQKKLPFLSKLIQSLKLIISDGPMIDYSQKSVGLGFRLRQSIVK